MSDVDDPDPTRIEQQTSVFVPDTGGGPPYEPPTAPVPAAVPPPPDRRPWIIAGLLALIVLVLILILVLQGDDDDGDDASTSSSTTTSLEATTTSSSTTVGPTTTTEAEVTTTTEEPVVTVPPDECAEAGQGEQKPGLAANAVYDAWVRGDQACAAELMTSDALEELFSRDGTDAHDDFQGCTQEDQPDPHTDCTFTYEGGATHYLMNYGNVDGWQVYDVTQVAD